MGVAGQGNAAIAGTKWYLIKRRKYSGNVKSPIWFVMVCIIWITARYLEPPWFTVTTVPGLSLSV